MITRISGTLLEKNPPQIVVDVQGLGYELDVPMSTFYNLPPSGDSVSLFTHFAVREDGHFLYGFGSAQEREVFRLLIKVSGVGARTALAILSGLSVDELHQAIVSQQATRLIKIPGIGKKTAERLLLELRDRLVLGGEHKTSPTASSNLSDVPLHTSVLDDVINALLALGYNAREAQAAVKGLPAESAVSDGIRFALKQLSRV